MKVTFQSVLSDFKALNFELSRQCLAIRKGLQDTQSTGAIFARHPLATELDSIALLKRIADTDRDRTQAEQARRLYYGCVGQFVRQDLLMMDESVDRFLVRAGILVEGERLSFPELVPWILSQKDYEKREMLRQKAVPLLDKADELKSKIWEATLRILREDFGYPNYVHYCELKKGLDFRTFELGALDFLDRTDDVYARNARIWAESALGRPFRNLSRYHAIFLLHQTDFNDRFPADRLMGTVRESLRAMGLIDPLDKTLFIDIEDRPGKSSVSRCVPLRIPEEVHISVKPLSGLSDYEAVFHEMGHGLHYAFTDPALPYPFRHLPRSFALSESFGFLFQNLTFDPLWLSIHTDMNSNEIEIFCRDKLIKTLGVIRRYMGKFLFELAFFSNGASDGGALYSKWLHRATGFVYDPDGAYMDLEEEFYSLDYVRAWVGEAALRAYLRDNFGEDWFQQKAAGDFLTGLWLMGEKISLDNVLTDLGRPLHDFLPLKRSLSGAVRRGTGELTRGPEALENGTGKNVPVPIKKPKEPENQ